MQAIKRTVPDEHPFIVDNTDILSGQIANLAILYFPQLVGNL